MIHSGRGGRRRAPVPPTGPSSPSSYTAATSPVLPRARATHDSHRAPSSAAGVERAAMRTPSLGRHRSRRRRTAAEADRFIPRRGSAVLVLRRGSSEQAAEGHRARAHRQRIFFSAAAVHSRRRCAGCARARRPGSRSSTSPSPPGAGWLWCRRSSCCPGRPPSRTVHRYVPRSSVMSPPTTGRCWCSRWCRTSLASVPPGWPTGSGCAQPRRVRRHVSVLPAITVESTQRRRRVSGRPRSAGASVDVRVHPRRADPGDGRRGPRRRPGGAPWEVRCVTR